MSVFFPMVVVFKKIFGINLLFNKKCLVPFASMINLQIQSTEEGTYKNQKCTLLNSSRYYYHTIWYSLLQKQVLVCLYIKNPWNTINTGSMTTFALLKIVPVLQRTDSLRDLNLYHVVSLFSKEILYLPVSFCIGHDMYIMWQVIF